MVQDETRDFVGQNMSRGGKSSYKAQSTLLFTEFHLFLILQCDLLCVWSYLNKINRFSLFLL